MKFTVAVLAGDGIGPEICDATVDVLEAVAKKYKHSFTWKAGLVGGISMDKYGTALTDETLAMCKKCDAVLFGAVGGPKWDNPTAKVRPEQGILAIRKGLKLFAHLRPVKMYPQLVDANNLKPDVVRSVDLVFIRELTGDIYFGKPRKTWQTSQGRKAIDTMMYTEKEIERVVRVGFELARTRRKKLTSVDKANVLDCSRLWRQIATELHEKYPDVELEHMYVDACSMRLIQNPSSFDVLVMGNLFGDILTDEGSMLGGSMGMLPSASLAGAPREDIKTFGLYEPGHGSAPKRAGLNMANPLATILSGAMMLRYSFAMPEEAQAIDNAVMKVLDEGYRTYDLISEGNTKVGTKEMGKLIAERV